MAVKQHKLYGIKNCDQVKKAQKWLDANDINYEFIDYTKSPFEKHWYDYVIKSVGIDKFLNKKSTTFRGLSQTEKDLSQNEEGVIELVTQYPKLMKRPILCEYSNEQLKNVIVGFSEEEYITFCGETK